MSPMRTERWPLNNNIIMITYDTAEPITTIWQLQYYNSTIRIDKYCTVIYSLVRYDTTMQRTTTGSRSIEQNMAASNQKRKLEAAMPQPEITLTSSSHDYGNLPVCTIGLQRRLVQLPLLRMHEMDVCQPWHFPNDAQHRIHVMTTSNNGQYIVTVSQDSSDEWNDRCATSFRPDEPAIFMFETSTCHHHGNRITIVVRVTYSIAPYHISLNNDDVSFGR